MITSYPVITSTDAGTHPDDNQHVSSPRIWEARLRLRVTARTLGIIPTYVGSTTRKGYRNTLVGDHPHVWGALDVRGTRRNARGIIPAYAGSTRRIQSRFLSPRGSSPRMRGAPLAYPTGTNVWGIIPAYAGSTFYRTCPPITTGDHPRVCGEHTGRATSFGMFGGSSPRMRGARIGVGLRSAGIGIIPAYAGSTLNRLTANISMRDHPRVCGEHLAVALCCPSCLGSSPRMRGAHFPYLRDEFTGGIIPAYAGSTTRHAPPTWLEWDHPRVCGEHHAIVNTPPIKPGSSPRMRGAHDVTRGVRYALGIIPAYAGSTTRRSRSRSSIRDHPRVCGEHVRFQGAAEDRRGSSPRMRGAHFEIPDIPMTWYMTGEFFIRFRRAWNCPPTQQGSSNTGLYGVGRPPR